jgi:uncharacterized protein (TIGR02246 family)
MKFTGILLVTVLLLASNLLLAAESADISALRALDQSYATRWIEGDADGVMALFTEDATLVPHHGDDPIKGHEAIRNFWFNPDYPPTVIPNWTREPAEFFVSGDVGVVRGTARLVWEYNGTRTTIPKGNYVLIAVRREQGWQIRMLTWNDDPNSWKQELINE